MSRSTRVAGRCSRPSSQHPIIAIRCSHNFIRGNGKEALVRLAHRSEDRADLHRLARRHRSRRADRLERAYQLQAFETLPFIPLGGYRQSAAWRDNVHGILKGPSVVFWNVSKD